MEVLIMDIRKMDILGGVDRRGEKEDVTTISLHTGETLAVVGPTGSGKSELLVDIEQLACGDTPSGRRILIDGKPCEGGSPGIVATLSQRTNFVMDADVKTFIDLHAGSLGKSKNGWPEDVLRLANTLCGEPMSPSDPLQRLSGGQTRALMIADIAMIADAPVVLIDEVENAGIDKHRALAALAGHGKIIVTATHDPVLMLMHDRRVVMTGGGMRQVIAINNEEKRWLKDLSAFDNALLSARNALREGKRPGREATL